MMNAFQFRVLHYDLRPIVDHFYLARREKVMISSKYAIAETLS